MLTLQRQYIDLLSIFGHLFVKMKAKVCYTSLPDGPSHLTNYITDKITTILVVIGGFILFALPHQAKTQ